jgi:hypothetical protein
MVYRSGVESDRGERKTRHEDSVEASISEQRQSARASRPMATGLCLQLACKQSS